MKHIAMKNLLLFVTFGIAGHRRPWVNLLAIGVLVVSFPVMGRCGPAETPTLIRETTDAVILENKALKIVVRKSPPAISSFVDKASGREFVDPAKEPAGLWRVQVKLPETKAETVESSAAAGCKGAPAGRDTVRLSWDLPERYALTVEATVGLLPGQAMSRWRVAVRNSGKAAIYSVRFPMMVARVPLGESADDDRLLLPICAGLVVERPGEGIPSGKERKIQYPGGGSCQVRAYYDGARRGCMWPRTTRRGTRNSSMCFTNLRGWTWPSS